jgi:hypothetical protein
MRTTVNVSEPLLENAKAFAAEHGMSLSGLLEDALRRRMAEREKPAAKKFVLPTVKGRLVNPNLDLDRTSALITSDDESEFGGS